MKYCKLTVAIGGILLLASCGKFKRCWTPPPNSLYFVVHKNGQELDAATNWSLRMFYVKDGHRIYDPGEHLNDTAIMYPASKYMGFDGSLNVWAGAYLLPEYYETNFWYLEFPDGDIDTLEVHRKQISGCKEMEKQRCKCFDPFTVVKFNGIDAEENMQVKAWDDRIVYLFNKL